MGRNAKNTTILLHCDNRVRLGEPSQLPIGSYVGRTARLSSPPSPELMWWETRVRCWRSESLSRYTEYTHTASGDQTMPVWHVYGHYLCDYAVARVQFYTSGPDDKTSATGVHVYTVYTLSCMYSEPVFHKIRPHTQYYILNYDLGKCLWIDFLQ